MRYVPGGYSTNHLSSSAAKGFTLPEMLIKLLILSVLLSIAAPSMRQLVADRRIAALAQQVYGSVVLARSEAVKRRSFVSLCRSEDGATCIGSGENWETGWLVFEDNDEDGELDSDDRLIRVYPALTGVVTLGWNNGSDLGFNSKGHARKQGTFIVCEQADGGSESREVILSFTGRTRVEERDAC